MHSGISIHALREEGDRLRSVLPLRCFYFYPRPPRGGRRGSLTAFLSLFIFLSTPSARRATSCQLFVVLLYLFLSTPSARRATNAIVNVLLCFCISIHALREEGDGDSYWFSCFLWDFYPRPPRGGRRASGCEHHDRSRFLSTPSARRATINQLRQAFQVQFLSTPSARRATLLSQICEDRIVISIHALREEGDTRQRRV